jgi:hypothetical protein
MVAKRLAGVPALAALGRDDNFCEVKPKRALLRIPVKGCYPAA